MVFISVLLHLQQKGHSMTFINLFLIQTQKINESKCDGKLQQLILHHFNLTFLLNDVFKMSLKYRVTLRHISRDGGVAKLTLTPAAEREFIITRPNASVPFSIYVVLMRSADKTEMFPSDKRRIIESEDCLESNNRTLGSDLI